jgi:hypothetical protein
MDKGAGVRRRQPYGQQRRVCQHAISHAERTIDQLRDEPDRKKKPPAVHSSFARPIPPTANITASNNEGCRDGAKY